jgi:cobalamin biosynthetic protein CobC
LVNPDLQGPVHGGALLRAAREYGIAPEDWLDLSTGVNPLGWPVPALSAECWQRLPQQEDGLVAAARLYYGTAQLLPVPGSQAAIQALPQLRTGSRIGVLSPAYAEHAHAWKREGHTVIPVTADKIDEQLPRLDVLVVVNPNNPTGERFSAEQLLQWHGKLAERDGWLVVDEAFIDATPAQSIASACGRDGLVVLRSLGKFFGLAGARVGFVLAWPELMQRMSELLGPWSVSGPSREVAQRALQDRQWQKQEYGRLISESERLVRLLSQYELEPAGGTALFQYCRVDDAAAWHERFASLGILVRCFDKPTALRFGLPGSENEWQRFDSALADLTRQEGRRSCR